MEKIQSRATQAFLSSQGYNCHMPREIVYAPLMYQGIGMRHLFDLQGTDSTRLLIQELNQEETTTNKMLTALLDTIQLESGIGCPILENCRPLDYIKWGWVIQIRDFLYHVNAQILGATEKPEPAYREHDTYLMDSNYLDTITKRERIYIHRCRLHLQVATLSDIATTDGTRINKTCYSNETTKPSRSLKKWPNQEAPFWQAWTSWRRFLSSFCDSSGKLKQPLGAWMRINENREHQAYLESGTNNLWYSKNNAWFIHEQIGKTHTSLIHETTPVWWKHKRKPSLTPMEILLETNESIRTPNVKANYQQKSKSAGNAEKSWFQRSDEKHSHLVGNIKWYIDADE
jgi:hypothetical protein